MPAQDTSLSLQTSFPFVSIYQVFLHLQYDWAKFLKVGSSFELTLSFVLSQIPIHFLLE